MPDSSFAVFGDIHSNLEALEAVLADMDTLALKARVCLGDIVGYAANPAQCLERIRGLDCPVVRGNHDDATAGDLPLGELRESAQRGIEFAREKLSAEQRAWLAALPLRFTRGKHQFVHASLSDPEDWCYLMGAREVHEHFDAQTEQLSFCGHTHFPIVWHLSNTGNLKAWKGEGRIELPPGGKTLVNVGSVGQPRDHQSTACYVVSDAAGQWVEFRRVKYPFTKTQRKILRAKLPAETAQRLAVGR